MIQMEEKRERRQSVQRPKILKINKIIDESPMVQQVSTLNNRPLGISENLYSIDSEARILQRIDGDDCRHLDLNSINPSTLA
jgi:hypothetical protein